MGTTIPAAVLRHPSLRGEEKKEYVYASRCNCHHYGNLCNECRTLNTSHYVGLAVPLCEEDFAVMKAFFLPTLGASNYAFYAWLQFWRDECTKHRYTYDRQCKFWEYGKFSRMSIYQWFRYLFQYL